VAVIDGRILMSEKVGDDYWEEIWRTTDLPRAVEPERDTLRNYSYHQFHLYFSKYLARQNGKSLIEFGCAQSIWLSYFGRYFALKVAGIDYSPTGCKKASAVLARAGVKGDIVQADFTNPPELLRGAYDFGASFGVAEHFEDTAECLAAFGRCLKPGALLFTAIPNLSGLAGLLQKALDRRIFDIHVPLDHSALAEAHRRASFDVVDCSYIVCSNFGVVTLGDQGDPLRRLRHFIKLAMMGFSAACWVIDRYVVRIPPCRILSPYIICVARKRGSANESALEAE
jgi:SAM-dependent methyltransferase